VAGRFHWSVAEQRAVAEEVGRWAEGLAALHARIAPHFERAEPRAQALAYLQGLLSAVERKNGWQLAVQAQHATPYRTQRLLAGAHWDVDRVRDDLRSYVLEHLEDPDGVWVLDETGFLKKGTQSVGVQRQHSGTAGRIENCQVGVFLAHASSKGRALVDRELYLPKTWTEYAERCRAGGVPEAVTFQTKPQLGRRMLERVLEAKQPVRWVTGDEVYGGDVRLRVWLEEHDLAHVLAVKRSEPLWVGTEAGPAQVPADLIAAQAPDAAWQRVSAGEGAKGPRLYDWVRMPIRPLREVGKGYWLLVRRSLTDATDLAYYVCFGADDTTLDELIRVAGARWAIEECFAAAKGEVGLDQYEVRRWPGWYRHVTLAMLAHAFLTVTRAHAVAGSGQKGGPA
jgi:SRSO17 transposase